MTKRRAAAPYGNRVVRTGTVKARDLLANPRNWRVHPQAQKQALDVVLTEVGFVQGLIVNLRTHASWGRDRGVETVLDGHARTDLALRRDEDLDVPVTWVDLTPEEEDRVLLTLDPIGAMAGRDAEKLAELLAGSAAAWPESVLDVDALLGTGRRSVAFESAVRHNVLVECASEAEQVALLERLRQEGMACRPTSKKA